MKQAQSDLPIRIPISAFLAWLVPGLGHWYIGERVRGAIFFVTITLTFWTGVAVGGFRATIDLNERPLWFMGQVCNGVYALTSYAASNAMTRAEAPPPDGGRTHRRMKRPSPLTAHWISTDVAIHYTGVAGLLNILIILDAMLRADPNIAVVREVTGAKEGGP